MATHGGIFVYDYISAKQNLRQDGLVYLRDSKSSNNGVLVWADVTSDPTGAWFLVFTAFPRDTSPYVTNAVGSSLPNPNDTSMRKLSDDNIRRILNNGQKETRTQWCTINLKIQIYGLVTQVVVEQDLNEKEALKQLIVTGLLQLAEVVQVL